MNDLTPNVMDLQLATFTACRALNEATKIIRENPALLTTYEAIGSAKADGYDVFEMLCEYMQVIELSKQTVREDAKR